MKTVKNQKNLWGKIVEKETIIRGLNKVKTDKSIDGYMVTLKFAKKYLSEDCLKNINKSDKNYFYFQESNSNEWIILAYEIRFLNLRIFNKNNYSEKAFEMYLESELSKYYRAYSIKKGFYNGFTINRSDLLKNTVKNKITKERKTEKVEDFSLDIFIEELSKNNKVSEADDIINNNIDNIGFVSKKADKFYNDKKYFDAKKCYLHLLKNSINVRVLYNLGVVYIKEQKFEYAEIVLKKVISIDSNYDKAYFNIGFCYFKHNKDMVKALNYFKKSLSLNPNDFDSETAVKQIENKIIEKILNS